jgi:hypothetical protein
MSMTPGCAAVVVRFGYSNGRHAVGAGASVADRKGELVATNADTGRLPNDIIAKALNSNLLDGKDSGVFATASHLHDGRYLKPADHTSASHSDLVIDASTLNGMEASALVQGGGTMETFAFTVPGGGEQPLALSGFGPQTRLTCLDNPIREAGIVLIGPTGHYTVQRTDGVQSYATVGLSTYLSTQDTPTGMFMASVDTAETADLLITGLVSTPTPNDCRVVLTIFRATP